MLLAEKAEIIARTAFANEWATLAHTIAVVQLMPEGSTDEELAVAWLHDVVEDTEVGLTDLEDMGFPENVIFAVSLLTRKSGISYTIYFNELLHQRNEHGRIARKVKLADARQNYQRCLDSAGIPKWFNLAENRYKPIISMLEGFPDGKA